MTTRMTKDCDRCGDKDNKTTDSFYVSTDSYTDPAGSRDYHSIRFELCSDCKTTAIKQLLSIIEMQGEKTEGIVSKLLNKRVYGS